MDFPKRVASQLCINYTKKDPFLIQSGIVPHSTVMPVYRSVKRNIVTNEIHLILTLLICKPHAQKLLWHSGAESSQ